MDEVYFEEDGVVSLWAGQIRVAPGSNFLKDLYGAEYYDPDNQECVVAETIILIGDLIGQLSYSQSFSEAAIHAAKQLKIPSAMWVMAQYDFAYDPKIAGLTNLPSEPKFIGKFAWHA